jgi:hypothetical protein
MNEYMITKWTSKTTKEIAIEHGTFATVQAAKDFIQYTLMDFEFAVHGITFASEVDRIAALKVGA